MKTLLFFILLIFSSISYGQNLTANFSANPVEVCLGETVVFTDLSTAGASPVVAWTWDFGDGFSSLVPSPNHVFTAAGTYNITLTIQAQDGTSDVEIKIGHIVVHPLPDVSFYLSAQGCAVPFDAVFVNNSSAGAYTYEWNFGNGQSSTDFTPTGITYTATGSYTVSLIVTSTATGCVDTLDSQIEVSNFVADMTVIDTACVNEVVFMTDATTVGANLWSWGFGDGSGTSDQNTFNSYAVAGTYTITLTAFNTLIGCTSTTTQTIVILPPPAADFTVSQILGCTPLTVTFTNTSVGGTIYNWNFGDGSTFVGATPPPHVYTDTGSYDVTLFAQNDAGCTSLQFYSGMVTVEELDAGFWLIPKEGCDPLDVQFIDTSFMPATPQDSIINWDWDFGNGVTYNGQFPPNQLYNVGLYSPSLTVTTAQGCVADTFYLDSITVGIIDTAGFTYFPIDQCAKVPVNFTNLSVISVPYDSSEVTYYWFFNDGFPPFVEGLDQSHMYVSDTGYFDVTMVVDFRGCTDTVTVFDAVHINAPIASFGTSFVVCNPSSFPVNFDITDNTIIGELSDDVEMIYNWGDGTSTYFDDPDLDDADQGSTSHTYNAYGDYDVDQIVHNYTTGCSDSIMLTLHVSQIEAEFYYSQDTMCFGTGLTLVDQTTSTHPVMTDTLYNRYNMGNGDSLYGPVQGYTYPAPGIYSVVHLATNSLWCIDRDTTVMTIVEPPNADVSVNVASGCAPLTAIFTNNTIVDTNGIDLDYFVWEFFDGTIDTTYSVLQPMFDTFVNEGNYITSMIAYDIFGCVSNADFVFTDLTKPTAAFVVNNVVCDLQDFTAFNQSTGAGPLDYQWFLDGNFENTILNYTNAFDEVESSLYNSVDHTITLVVADTNGCLDTLELPIVVSLPHADANFAFNGATLNAQGEFACPPVFASLIDSSNSYGTITNWNWAFGNGNFSTLQDPQNTYVYAGTYTSTLSIIDEYGCVDDTTFLDYVTINGPSGDPYWVSVGTFCDPAYEFYTGDQVGITNVEWILGDGNIVNDTSAFTYVYDTTANYVPMVIISDDNGCEVPYQLPQITNVFNELDAFFTASILEGEVSEIFTFIDGSTTSSFPIVDWEWDFGDWSQLNNTNADIDSYWGVNGYQTITLTVYDANGCSATYSIQVEITAEFLVPNVFTPNGDGINDNFQIDFDVFQGYHYVIINRWGNVIVEEDDHHGIILWDGTDQSDLECNDGVYFYKISGSLYDGTKIVKHGHVTLVR